MKLRMREEVGRSVRCEAVIAACAWVLALGLRDVVLLSSLLFINERFSKARCR